MKALVRAAAAATGLLACIATPASSEEGFWTYDNFPAARMQRELGWAPDQAWLDRVMVAAARLPGCSGANVSGQGLMLTNHHCVTTCLRNLSSADADYLRDGFMARTREEELRCPNLTISVLSGVSDVTDRIGAATAGMEGEGFAYARDAAIARIERECTNATRRCEVTTLYQGARYALYRYKIFDDVRMVFAPETAVAAFGGDPDNYSFPRYCLDIAFLRLYERGAPALTPAHLRMRFTPHAEDEIVLTAGDPGATSRLRTTAEFAFARDYQLPYVLSLLAEMRGRLVAYSRTGPEQQRIGATALQGVENLIKRYAGQRAALLNAEGFARATAAEQDLQARVRRNRAAARDVGDAWGEIERAEEGYRSFFHQHMLLEAQAGPQSQLFGWGRDLVRAAAERARPDAERMPRYTQARLAVVESAMFADQPVQRDFEQLNLEIWLLKVRQQIGVDNVVVRRVLGAESPEQLALRLSQSRLADPAYRRELWMGGAAAVAASDDPMIVFIRGWDADARAVRARYEREVEGPVALAHERIARARFRAFGLDTYPDATGTPRLSYGQVRGWTEDGRVIAPFTRLSGLYRRATGAPPYALPQRWLDARPGLNPETIYNVSLSTESVGGSSGSPVLDRDGRVVGANFDGNIHATGGAFYYDPALNRSVAVTATAMQAALAQVYAMDALLAELNAD